MSQPEIFRGSSAHGRRAIDIPGLVLVAIFLVLPWPDAVSETVPEASPAGVTATEIGEQIRPQVEQLRSLTFKRDVPIRIIDETAAREHMLQRLQDFLTPAEIQSIEQAYALLGLMPPGLDLLATFLDVMREQAGGFYDPDSGAFYVLERIPRDMIPVVIAHELTHALEDQHYDLDKRLHEVKDDDDQLFARSAVHEGSATLVMTLYMSSAVTDGEVDPESLQEFSDSEARRLEALDKLPPVFQRQLLAPYLIGSSFLVRGNLMGLMGEGYPHRDVNRAYEEPPRSSEQILHPEKYWDAERRDDPKPVDLGDAGTALGRRWSKRSEGVLGELTVGVLVGAATPISGVGAQDGGRWTNEAAKGWGGDRWELWKQGEQAVVLLGTVWDSEADAQQFAAALPTGESLSPKVAGDRVAVVAGESAGGKAGRVLERILAALE